jgi:hypothetical protein
LTGNLGLFPHCFFKITHQGSEVVPVTVIGGVMRK